MKLRLLLLVGLFVSACGPSRAPAPITPNYLAQPPVEFPLASGVASPNDIGRFLAGKPVRRGQALSRYQQTVQYQAHHEEIAPLWRHVVYPRVQRMERWAGSEITPVVGSAPVFYPFGGPDLLHAAALFPESSTYVLIGLEPPGEVPALESIAPGDVFGALASFRQATKTQLSTGYFITKDMRTDLDHGVLRGVTPILLATVGLLGGEVQSVENISVGGYPAVQLRYLDAIGLRRTVYYISGDLSNNGFNSGYQQWLANLGGGACYFKAASYLMHDSRFSKARDFFLSQSRVVLQDDSGIPFRYFPDERWNIKLYGTYEKPIELFAKHQQEDLRQAFTNRARLPLSFLSGYQYKHENANLMRAIKR